MLATLWLVGLSLPMLWAQRLISCPYKNVCQYALLSGSDVILQCNYPKALWYFSSSLEDKLSLVNSKPDGRVLPGSDLQLSDPKPSQTGLYRCLDNHKARLVEYEIDFQNIALLHITHKDLGQEPMGNESMNLGGKVLVFTRWDPWQDCNRCQKPGERKRLGYCYVEEPQEKPMPCWLYLREEKVTNSRLRPELQLQACQVPCDTATETNQPYFVFDTYLLDKPNSNARLKCPLASIYRPVHWEADNSPLTWQDQLSGQTVSTIMDLHSGGQHLKVFQPATYRCFVEQELIAQFNPTERQSKAQNPWQPRIQPDKADSVLRRLKLMVLSISVLAVGGLLCKVVFRPVCGKKRSQVLLVK
ncbi:protein FAM187B isoform 1 precursor [Mus musculus]|uniref:Protein FAM187B n=1 Tax=Mus musculus TaxID=10090 RepID=F187B_MOUSE|nr:protein FAM187B isoform 1 precursor [Mus musculus]Q0VAY3.1 RecName: Full=Protein FAM187B; AltName: Full=Transmembrane protein 162; Flags: Precursor [Mus musculus]AAI20865.1 Transmembrane protein 162 [Mus musculus]AAI25561.1 Transmembrane protein 162 [Mus musculus]|eukprot:NP_780449.2 protein FAM187B isoform 1 precursor [Mus musculus]